MMSLFIFSQISLAQFISYIKAYLRIFHIHLTGDYQKTQEMFYFTKQLILKLLFLQMESRSYMSKTSNNFKEKSHPNFAATSMAQNFFSSNDNDDFQYPAMISKSYVIPKKQPTSSRRQSRKKIQEASKLQPVKQAQKIDIFQGNILKNNWDDLQEIVFQTPKKKEVISTDIHAQRTHTRRRNSLKPQKKQVPTIQKIQVFQQTTLQQKQQLPKQTKQPKQRKQSKEQKQFNQQKAILLDQQPIFLPLRPTLPIFKDEQDQKQQQVQQQKQPRQQQQQNSSTNNATGSSKIFDFEHQSELVKQIFAQVQENTTLKMQIVRDKGGFNRFWPQFHLRFVDDKQHLMSAKKTSSKPASTFIISRAITDFSETGPSYLGKVKSNVLGDTYNIYGPGLNPSTAEQKKKVPRDLLATLMYNTSLFYANGPRKFSVFVKNPQTKYYKDFPQVSMYGQEIPLSSLYSYHNNKQKIKLIFNKKPLLNQKSQTYFLDFKGKAPVTSIKNFILEEQQNGPQILLFGKTSQDSFNLEISTGISPYVAFALAVASFDNRLISQ